MKFWQKIFISVLLLFLISFNVSVIVMMHLFTENTTIAEEESAVNGAYIAESALYGQFISFYRYDTLQYENKKRSFFGCSSTYQYKQIYLQYYEGNEILFTSFPDETLFINWADAKVVTNYLSGDAQVIYFSKMGTNYIAVRTGMDYPFDQNSLVYIYSLKNYEGRRQNLIRGFIVIEAIFAFTTCILLYFVVRNIMKPLPRLSDAVTKIASGKYDEKLPVSGKDEIAVLSGKINDLSDKISESIQELKKSAEEKQHFIDDLGHEIRTPLTSISGYAEYLNMAVTTQEEKKQALEYIISESHRLEHLSGTLLELASIREGEIAKTNIDAGQIADYVTQLFQPRCLQAGIKLNVVCETDTIYSDRDLLMILISNLIENAIRASASDSFVHFTIRNMRKMGYKKTVITVEDNGIGMTREEIDKIEEPFYRVDKARSRESGGVGLGVSLCKQIVRVHDGTMKYESAPGKGTRVTVVIPEEDNIFELV